jgi:hypothetical protein
MAIAFVANRINTAVTAVGFSTNLAMAAGGSITVGNHLILEMALDNSGTGGVDPNCEGITDPRGNTWVRIGKATKSAGSANDGAHAEVWFTRVVVPYSNGDAITPRFSFSVARGCFLAPELSGVRPISYPIDVSTGFSTNSTIGPFIATPTAAGQIVMGMAAIETNAAITGDADTTNGAWSTISTVLSDSGVDATSMTLSAQRKIVTAAGGQSLAFTKTGASDFAGVIWVLDSYTPTSPSFTPGNPNYPCIAGPENLGIASTSLPIDSGTGYMFTHKIFPNDVGTQDYAFVASVGVTSSMETDPVVNHTIVGDVYLAGNELPDQDFLNTVTLFVNSATLGSGAETWNPETDSTGSGTALAALSAVGGECIRLQAGEHVDVRFDPTLLTTLFPSHRILRWGIRYVAFKDDSEAPGPTNGMNVTIWDTEINAGSGGSYLAGGWLVNNYRGNSQYETRWFGEVNGNPRAFRTDPLSVSVLPLRACWTPTDIGNMASGELYVQIEGSVSDVFIDYVEAVVELAPERRLAHGARTVSTAPFNEGIYPTGNHISKVVLASDASQRWIVSDTDSEYVLVIREALPPSPSDLYPIIVDLDGGDRTIAPMESIGPALKLTAPAGPRSTLTPYPGVRVGVLSRGTLAEPPVESNTWQSASVTALDAINYPIEGTFFPSYYLASVSSGISGQVFDTNDLHQYIVVPGGQQYTRIKLLVRKDQLTVDDLEISLEKPPATPIATATITTADVDGATDVGLGFVEISVPLSVAITPTAGRVYVVMSSTTPSSAPWNIGGALPPFIYAGYDVSSPTASTEYIDYSVVLECPLASPTYTLGSATVDVTVGSETCTTSTTTLPTITLSNGGSYSHIAIWRSADGGDLVPVILIDDATNGLVVTDYEVPWDYPTGTITYTIIGYRDSDHLTATATTTAWSGTSTAPGAAFGIFSNDLQLGYAYIPVDERELVTEYNPLNPISFVQRHGVDYQLALRAPEERGMSVTVSVIADRVALCENSAEPDRTVMSPTPFDAIRSLDRNQKMVLKTPGGNNRFVFVKPGTMSVRTQRGTYMAELTFTDVEPRDIDPYA